MYSTYIFEGKYPFSLITWTHSYFHFFLVVLSMPCHPGPMFLEFCQSKRPLVFLSIFVSSAALLEGGGINLYQASTALPMLTQLHFFCQG
jgi:hypothetical protein